MREQIIDAVKQKVDEHTLTYAVFPPSFFISKLSDLKEEDIIKELIKEMVEHFFLQNILIKEEEYEKVANNRDNYLVLKQIYGEFINDDVWFILENEAQKQVNK
jgi:hypothetical protein